MNFHVGTFRLHTHFWPNLNFPLERLMKFVLTVSCPQTQTSDGEKLNNDALCGVSLNHLSGVELIWDSKQNT